MLPSEAFAWSTPVGLGLWIVLALFAGGMPFRVYGVCWAFLGQRIMAGARDGEGDRAAASIAALEMTGIAVGAALAAIMGNALGVDDRAGPANLRAAAGLGHALFLPILLFATAAAARMVRVGRAARGHDLLSPSRG